MANEITKVSGVAFILVLIFLLMLIPVIVVSTDTITQKHLTQEDNERVTISSDLYSTVENHSINSTNITLTNQKTGNVYTINSLNRTESQNISLSNLYINVTYTDYVNDRFLLISYEYPTFINWPSEAQFLAENIEIYILVMTLLFITSIIIMYVEIEE